jgi:hypothetical protein
MMPPLNQRDGRPAERPPEHDLKSRHWRDQRFFQKAKLAVPDDLDAAEHGREQDAHRDDAGRQELHIIAVASAGEGRAKPETERQQEEYRLTKHADHAGS